MSGQDANDDEIGSKQMLHFGRIIYVFSLLIFAWDICLARDGGKSIDFRIIFPWMTAISTTDMVTLEFRILVLLPFLTSHRVWLRHDASVCYFFPHTCGVGGAPWWCCCGCCRLLVCKWSTKTRSRFHFRCSCAFLFCTEILNTSWPTRCFSFHLQPLSQVVQLLEDKLKNIAIFRIIGSVFLCVWATDVERRTIFKR